ALLKVDAKDLPMLTLSPEAIPSIGTRVYAIGSPRDLCNTLSEGLVSGLRRETPGVTHIQTTAPISPGSSGGPLLDESGRVIGVTSAFRADGQNLNFAVGTGRVSELLDIGRFYLEAIKAPGSPRWWLANAMRNASAADETRPTVFLTIGQAAMDAGDVVAAGWAARFAERAGLSGGDTGVWQIPVAQLYRQANESDRASRLLESAGIPPTETPPAAAGEDHPMESDRKLVLACAQRAAANQIDAACDIASEITSWRERAQAVRLIARALTGRAEPLRVLSWIEQQGTGWEGAQLRAIGCLGPIDAQR
ncbi:MAG: S1C family serine protease, partial [Tepidisphaerales bacterium]